MAAGGYSLGGAGWLVYCKYFHVQAAAPVIEPGRMPGYGYGADNATELVLGFFNMHVAFNLFTVLVAGILHLPGLVMLVVLSHWFV